MTRQIERLRPHQIAAALAERAVVYLPLGTIEWHCHHLPVGLDGLTAHGLCLAAADRTGGLVWPALYYGTGGGHGAFPWTVMMPDGREISALLQVTLGRLGALGIAEAVLFSGHFADEQLAIIDRIAATWNAQGRMPHVIALAVSRAAPEGFPPDHAGLFETTLLTALWPGLADLRRLSAEPDSPDRFDPQSPLWGVVGVDPRQTPPIDPAALVARIVGWIAAHLDNSCSPKSGRRT